MPTDNPVPESKGRFVLACLLSFTLGGAVGSTLLYVWHERETSAWQEQKYAVTGEVFLVGKTGEPLPAPGARVHIFPVASEHGIHWLRTFLEVSVKAEQNDKQRLQTLRGAMATYPTRKELLDPLSPDWSTTSDSSGKFNISIPPGLYFVVATGRVGSTESVWSDRVEIPTTLAISLANPVAVYADGPSRDH